MVDIEDRERADGLRELEDFLAFEGSETHEFPVAVREGRQEDLLDQGVRGPEGGERVAFDRPAVTVSHEDLLDLVQAVSSHAGHDVREARVLPHPQEADQARLVERSIVSELDRLGRSVHGLPSLFLREGQIRRRIDVVDARFETRLHDPQVEPREDQVQDDVEALECLGHRVDLGGVNPVRLCSSVRKFRGESLRRLETSIRDHEAFDLRTLGEERSRNRPDRACPKDNRPNDVGTPRDCRWRGAT